MSIQHLTRNVGLHTIIVQPSRLFLDIPANKLISASAREYARK